MADKLISPGVFTEENDQSFLAQGVQEIASAFVGPTERGPAFEAVQVSSPSEYIQTFGNGGFYTDRTVINYLQTGASARVVRTLGGSPSALEEGVAGYVSNVFDLTLSGTGDTDGATASVLAPTQAGEGIVSVTATGSFDDFTLDVDLGTSTRTYSLSLVPGSNNYIREVFGADPKGFLELYVAADLEEFHDDIVRRWESGGTYPSVEATEVNEGLDFDNTAYSEAATPWIVSQDLLEEQPNVTEIFRLFRFHTLSSGTDSNREVKVTVENVRTPSQVPASEYGTFTVTVRDYNDADANPRFLETYTDVNLDPTSPQYIARVIGNRTTEYRADGTVKTTGEYQNVSSYVRVEVADSLVRANDNGRNDRAGLVPWGFEGYVYPFEADGSKIPAGTKFRETQARADYDYEVDMSGVGTEGIGEWTESGVAERPFDRNIYLGFDFRYRYNHSFLSPVPNAESVVSGPSFNMSDVYLQSTDPQSTDPSTGDTLGSTIDQRKFAVGFQGGFDGLDPRKPINLGDDITAENQQGLDCSTFDAVGTLAYRDAFTILSNSDDIDINLLTTPGVVKRLHPAVTEAGISLAQGRGDTFYILDSTLPDDSVQAATQQTSDLNTNYAATYYPWLRTLNPSTNRIEEVPPSVLLPRVFAFNDQVGFEWSAPAGLTRGGINAARETVVQLNRDQRDELYAARINPIAQYDGDVVVWGQKTLQALPSALDRINVRRLLINVKKFIASTSRFLVFEPNTAGTRNQFVDLVTPYLERVQEQAGIFAFRVQADAENNPPDVVDRNILRGSIYLQPSRTAEFLELDFNVLPTGASFGDE